MLRFIYSLPNEVGEGYTGFIASIHLSVCLSIHLSVDGMVFGV